MSGRVVDVECRVPDSVIDEFGLKKDTWTKMADANLGI